MRRQRSLARSAELPMEPMDALEAIRRAGAARWASLQSADPWGRGSGHRRDSRRSSRRTAIGPSPSRLATERKATLKPPTIYSASAHGRS
jgi:hypothetical protein